MNTMSEQVTNSELEVSSTDTQGKVFSFDRNFQEKIVQACLVDRLWASQFSEVLDVNYFHYPYLKLVAYEYFQYHTKYKEFPSFDLLLNILKDKLKNDKDSLIREQIKSFLVKVNDNQDLGDLGYVKDKSLDFCKKIGLQRALEQSVDLLETEKYEKIVDVIKNAITAGNSNTPGLDLFSDIDARYSETYRKTVATGITELDSRKILNGGLGAGELGICIAPTGVGKSHFLVHIGASALKQGKNVLHYTYELNERAVGIRYDSHLIGINSIECYEHREKIKKYYEDNNDNLGRLKVKYYPTGTATINTIRSHVEKLAIQENFRPDIVIIDYAGIMRSTEKYDLLRLELKKIYEELRSLANELDLPIWSASQSNKEGADKDYVDLTNMAEAYGQAHVADFILGLSRKSLDKSTGYGSVFIAKNRNGIDGVKYHVHLDTSRSTLRIVTEDELRNIQPQDDEETEDSMKFLRKRFKEIQKKSDR